MDSYSFNRESHYTARILYLTAVSLFKKINNAGLLSSDDFIAAGEMLEYTLDCLWQKLIEEGLPNPSDTEAAEHLRISITQWNGFLKKVGMFAEQQEQATIASQQASPALDKILSNLQKNRQIFDYEFRKFNPLKNPAVLISWNQKDAWSQYVELCDLIPEYNKIIALLATQPSLDQQGALLEKDIRSFYGASSLELQQHYDDYTDRLFMIAEQLVSQFQQNDNLSSLIDLYERFPENLAETTSGKTAIQKASEAIDQTGIKTVQKVLDGADSIIPITISCLTQNIQSLIGSHDDNLESVQYNLHTIAIHHKISVETMIKALSQERKFYQACHHWYNAYTAYQSGPFTDLDWQPILKNYKKGESLYSQQKKRVKDIVIARLLKITLEDWRRFKNKTKNIIKYSQERITGSQKTKQSLRVYSSGGNKTGHSVSNNSPPKLQIVK